MIRFVELKTGNTFDGESPYVFWFEKEQSTNLIYSLPICFISPVARMNISIEDNDIFSLVDTSKLINPKTENMYGFDYHNINELKSNFVYSDGVAKSNYYIHVIYIIASAKVSGEYICKFSINNVEYQVGADFYDENESLYVNLSNNGVEIPEIVQKAIYNVNVHEEKKDNITLNRKWKELLSNYWDIMANKGSHKSLYNSLKWFEYGDLLQLCELWKNPETGKLFSQDLKQILTENYMRTLNGFAKTTYIALYCALEKPTYKDGKMVLDEERNPQLEYISSKWSTQDLALKLCMLGNFYETYFMPIHLDLIHSTIEDVVYSNTIKIVRGNTLDRSDFIFNTEDIKCNVKNGDLFRLGFINSYVGPNTLFGLSYEEFKDQKVIIGVQTEEVETLSKNEDWAAYASQMYSEIGALAEFELEIPLIKGDKIKREILLYKTYSQDENGKYIRQTKTVTRYNILDGKIKFCLFCPIEGEYDVRLQFDTMESKTYTKHVSFKVIDTTHIAMNVYKIQNLQMLDDYQLGDASSINNYHFIRRKDNNSYKNSKGEWNLAEMQKYLPVVQYVPAKIDNLIADKFNWKGICLNHLVILNGNLLSICNKGVDLTDGDYDVINRYYYIAYKYVGEHADNIFNKCYTILVSRTFGFHVEDSNSAKRTFARIKALHNMIYRDDYIFVPEFHKLVELDNNRNGRLENIEYYTVTDDDTLCVVPELAYSKDIAEYDWEFINASRPLDPPIKISHIKEPFITTGTRSPLTPGYYTIKFHYRLTNEDKINTIELNSAFKKV